MRTRLLASVFVPLFFAGCGAADEPLADTIPHGTGLTIVDSFEHKPNSFTQGLEFVEPGVLVESAGSFDNPGVMSYEVPTSEDVVDKRVDSRPMPAGEFAEGLTVVDGELLQLTWQDERLLRWSYPDLDLIETQSYEGEGWGLCYDESTGHLWRSDGTATLYRHDPDSFDVLDTVAIHDDAGMPITNINELECVGGEIWANIWFEPVMVRIDPEQGSVLDTVDLSLVDAALAVDAPDFVPNRDQVLNGLAWDPENDQLYVTGKEWPMTYVLEFTR